MQCAVLMQLLECQAEAAGRPGAVFKTVHASSFRHPFPPVMHLEKGRNYPWGHSLLFLIFPLI